MILGLEQYSDYLYLYILFILLIPASLCGILKKNIKYYGLFVSIIMILIITGGIDKSENLLGLIRESKYKEIIQSSSIKIILLSIFVVFEIVLIKIYLYVRKATDNKYIYYLFLVLSMMPLIILKISTITKVGVIGFVGLSYLNFKAIQMIIEIYDRSLKEVKLFTILYFIIFFPTLSSGPIDRYRRFEKDINKKIESKEYINNYLIPGIEFIFRGILYKFAIAALISTLWIDSIPKDVSWYHGWKYMYAYTFFLFFDFAGYSAFAIGTSYILGVKTPINFNKPFISKDMKEFWTRWHISLSRWFGDYIFSRFVLNSMRKKRFKNRIIASHIAQMLTMGIMGVWHGFEIYYILYGLYQGGALVLTDIYQRKSKFYKKHKKDKWFQYIEIVITFHIVSFGMLIFSGYGFQK